MPDDRTPGYPVSVERLPKRLRIGSFTFKLLLVAKDHPDLNGEDDEGEPYSCLGLTDAETTRILMATDSEFDQFVNTLIHEIGHAINHSYGIHGGEEEEHITTQSANGWMQVNLDNPRLENWLHAAWRALRKTR
jgi:hypothetical protein